MAVPLALRDGRPMSSMQYPEFIWQNGKIKPWAEGTTHVMAHALHYGSSVFKASAATTHPTDRPSFA